MDNLENEALETESTNEAPRKRQQRRQNPRAEAERIRARGPSEAERIPMGVVHQKLSVRDYDNQLEGYSARFFNDTGNRINDAIKGGWMPVYQEGNLDLGDGEYDPDRDIWVSQVVGTQEGGKPLLAYLMKIKKEWYDADQANKAAKIQEVDDAISKRGIDQPIGDQHYVKTAKYDIGSKA